MKKCFKIKEHKRGGVIVSEHIRCIKDDNNDIITLEQQREGISMLEYYELKRNNKLKKPLAEHIAERLRKSGYKVEIDLSSKSLSAYVKVYHEGVYTKIRVSNHNNMTSYLSDYNIDSRSNVESALNILRKDFKII
jgi:hypothetical protein